MPAARPPWSSTSLCTIHAIVETVDSLQYKLDTDQNLGVGIVQLREADDRKGCRDKSAYTDLIQTGQELPEYWIQ